jgi:hypothetical protein
MIAVYVYLGDEHGLGVYELPAIPQIGQIVRIDVSNVRHYPKEYDSTSVERLLRIDVYERDCDESFAPGQSPNDRDVASRCCWAFGSAECGYVINAAAAYTTCPKTLSACIARGQDHAARGLPVLHPARFGGFPGIHRHGGDA